MDAPKYAQLHAIFERACELPPGEREAYLDQACCGQSGLRREIEELLDHDERPISFVDQALVGGGAEVLARGLPEPREPLPERVGRYRLLRVIGEGGMGVVYEAEQDDPKRRVALKVIRPGMVTGAQRLRLRREAHVLGRLRHPGIAQIFEAGTAENDGPVFFAMELVIGRPLLAHTHAKGMDMPERLSLLAEICDAVDHVHQNGVIHRDLKPENILVESESGRPKVLDFGVARATDADLRTVTAHTSGGQLIGTVPYMSPEQAAGDLDQLDQRSDVYSLGVISYELLTGQLPYPVQGKMIHEAVRIIQHDEPSRIGSVNGACRGDLETIIAKALEKDKVRRYQSAGDLAADIRRYLADRPILARPASVLYRVRKFVKRRRPLVASVAIAAAGGVMLTAGALAVAYSGRARTVESEQPELSVGRSGGSSSPDVRWIRSADDWMAANPDAGAYAFDQFHPGVDSGGGVTCLLDAPIDQPVTFALAGGTMRLASFNAKGAGICAVRDGSALARVSDAWISPGGGKVVIDFDPPITAFYSMFGSLAKSATTSEALFARGRMVAVTTSAPSEHEGDAQGCGFVSSIPIDRIEVTTTDPGSVVIGAFRTMRPGESNLGTVSIPGYGGPQDDDVFLDFACVFDHGNPGNARPR